MQEIRVVVALSGGLSSAYCAKWAFDNYEKEKIVLYFNDTRWEHSDLYRFLNELSNYFDHPITYDSDGRCPELLFYDNNALANNRMPFCSRVLKAERLQKFYKDEDLLVFGIGPEEKHRADRIRNVYDAAALKTNKKAYLEFPLISNNITKKDIDEFLQQANIRQPLLYDLGFDHNNCSGGCVRAGKRQWAHLYKMLPKVYAERERESRRRNA